MKIPKRKSDRLAKRYGAGEIFGRAVTSLSPEELRKSTRSVQGPVVCPFKSGNGLCNKKGGVCSLVQYEKDSTGVVRSTGLPITTCPSRFLEDSLVFQWVGQTLLGTSSPKTVSELSFLMSINEDEAQSEDEVGRIDRVLVDIKADRLDWCALEMQAVYFSGRKMESDFSVMRTWQGPDVPFPTTVRRPDFRSSGPKRLMPQLQIKVPTLRRWGKKNGGGG